MAIKFVISLLALAACVRGTSCDGDGDAEPQADSGQCAWNPDAPPAAPPPPAILGLSGSLRRLSSNTALLRAAMAASSAVAPSPVSLAALPHFDADLEEAPLPAEVAALRAAAFAARAFLFATPEYNGLTSSALKNALDWLSRAGPEGRSPLAGKPYAVVSAGGGSGGLRGQRAVDLVAGDLKMQRVEGPLVAVKLFDGVERFDGETGTWWTRAWART